MSENGSATGPMAPLKFGFGFSKIIKKPNLLPNGASSAKNSNIELIDSIEGSSIKVIGKNPEDEAAKRLVIPMTNDQKSTPLSKLIEERLRIANNRKIKSERVKKEPEIKQEPLDIKTEPLEETLEQQAARELIEDLQSKVEIDDTKVFEVPINPDDLPLEGAAESTMDDYENVPIKDFGMAMLRGMGFKDEDKKDDSKKPDLDMPIMRPRGMGLGADKVVKKQPLLVAPGATEVLEIKKRACVKVLAGKHKNLYATVRKF